MRTVLDIPDADVRTFWHNIGFSEIYGVSARTRGESQFFAILCGRPLWTDPYEKKVL